MSITVTLKPRTSGAFCIAWLIWAMTAPAHCAYAQEANDMAPPVREAATSDSAAVNKLHSLGLTGSFRSGYWSSNR